MIVESQSRRMTRSLAAYMVVALFVFPLHYWATTAFKNAKEIFSTPPIAWTFEPTLKNFEEVFGISLGFFRRQEVLPGGGNFYMAPRLWDSIVAALGSTALSVVVATLAAYGLSRMDFRGRHAFVGWVTSTRMMPPVAVAIPMFFIYKDIGLMDSHPGIILVQAVMNLPLAVLLLKSFFDDIPRDLDECALIDCASRWTIFRRIVPPMAKRGVAATAALRFIFSWTEFVHALTLTPTGLKTVPVVSSGFVTSTGTPMESRRPARLPLTAST